MSEELKNCPFCGGKRIVCKTDGDRFVYGWVSCKDCGCRTSHFDTVPEAIIAWNTRAPVKVKALEWQHTDGMAEFTMGADCIRVMNLCGVIRMFGVRTQFDCARIEDGKRKAEEWHDAKIREAVE